MSNKDISKDVLGAISKKTGKNISENQVKKLASNVTPDTVKNEAELRKLIKQVSEMANVPVSEQTTNDIVKAVTAGGSGLGHLETLIKMMIKK